MDKPDRAILKAIYRSLITGSEAQRIQVLSQALQWYDVALPYVIAKEQLAPAEVKERQRWLKKGSDARALGVSEKHLPARETAFKMALRMNEKVCRILHPPKVDKYYNKYLETRTKLEADAIRLQDKFSFLLQTLSSALPSSLTLKVIDHAQKPRMFNGASEFAYSRDHADAMRRKLRREGLLVLVAEELPYLARALAREADGSGSGIYSPQKQVNVMTKLLHDFVKYAKSDDAPNRLVKRGYVAREREEESTEETKEKKPKAATVRGKKSNEDRYIPGSCIDFLYKRLKNEKSWDVKELFAGAPANDPMQPLKRLVLHGDRYGDWKVAIAGDKVKMTMVKK